MNDRAYFYRKYRHQDSACERDLSSCLSVELGKDRAAKIVPKQSVNEAAGEDGSLGPTSLLVFVTIRRRDALRSAILPFRRSTINNHSDHVLRGLGFVGPETETLVEMEVPRPNDIAPNYGYMCQVAEHG